MTGALETTSSPRVDPEVTAHLAWSKEQHRWEHASTAPLPDGMEYTRGRSVVICTYERPESLLRCLTSLREQLGPSDELLIVDASSGSSTEDAVRMGDIAHSMAAPFRYFRVAGRYRGLTRQRNFALDRVTRDLVAFFDDDTVLLQECLSEMERVHRELGEQVVGVGALVQDGKTSPDTLWRLRKWLRVVPDLQPGAYCRSGLAIPWEYLSTREGWVDGDWVSGCAMMWRTELAKTVRFYEDFAGYAQGEDLEFSLRMRAAGRIIMACGARVRHFVEPAGRPAGSRMGYMAIHNRYLIHRRCLSGRRWQDVVWLGYACGVDTAFVAAHFLIPRRWSWTASQLAGRGRAFLDLLRGR